MFTPPYSPVRVCSTVDRQQTPNFCSLLHVNDVDVRERE